jgi:phosphoglycolate phosphatase
MQKLANIKALAIDLDGTLLDTIPDLCGAVNRALAELGHRSLPIDLVKTFVGKGLGEHMRKSLREVLAREPSDDEKRVAMALYRKHYAAHLVDQTTMYPHVIETLEHFRERGVPMAVVTNKWFAYTEQLVAHFGLARYFDHLVCGDTLTTNKPDPGMMFYAAGRMNAHPNEMLMIGDSGNDSRAAQAAGAPVVLLSYGYSEGEDLIDLQADAIVDTFADIPPLFETAFRKVAQAA